MGVLGRMRLCRLKKYERLLVCMLKIEEQKNRGFRAIAATLSEAPSATTPARYLQTPDYPPKSQSPQL